MEKTLTNSIFLQFNKNTNWIILLVVLVIVFGTYYPSMFADFQLFDDHCIIRYSTNIRVHDQLPLRSSFTSDYLELSTIGRFWPVVGIHQSIYYAIFGPNPLLWRIVVMGYALITVMLLYFAASRILQSFIIGGIFSLWILQAPNTEIWSTILVADHLGMVYLAGCLFCITYSEKSSHATRWDWAALGCFICASMVKESFMLVAPALLFMRWHMRNSKPSSKLGESAKPYLLITLIYVLWTMLLIIFNIYLVVSRGESGQGAGFLHIYTALKAFFGAKGIFWSLPRYSVWFIPIIGFIILRLINKQRDVLNTSRHILIFTFLWVVPQMILYTGRGATMEGRYWVPMIVGLCLPSAFALKVLMEEERAKRVCMVVCVILFLWMARCIQINYTQSVNFKDRTYALANMVHDVTASIPDNGTIVIVASPKTEEAFSLLHRFGINGKPHVSAYLFQPDGNNGDLAGFVGHNNPEILKPDKVDAVVYLRPGYKSTVEKQSWYDSKRFNLHKSIVKQHFLSLRKFSLASFDYGFEYDLVKENEEIDRGIMKNTFGGIWKIPGKRNYDSSENRAE